MSITNKWKHVLRAGFLLALLPAFTACVATVGSENMKVPNNSAGICEGHCQSIGMHLSAVAIMAENVGCVCQYATTTTSAEKAGAMSTPIAGMATIAMQRAAARQAAQQQQQRRTH